jgi:hypothetical protein
MIPYLEKTILALEHLAEYQHENIRCTVMGAFHEMFGTCYTHATCFPFS